MAAADNNTVIRTFKFRLLPTRKQYEALEQIRESQRILYNAAKQEREDCFEKTGKGRSLRDQCKAVTELRKDAEYANVPANLQRWTLKRLDDSFQAFFRRVRTGDAPGCPRFKGKARWHSFGFAEFSGITLIDNRVRFKGLPGSLKVHLHRQLPDQKLLSCVFIRDHKGWAICIHVGIPCEPLPKTNKQIGIDMGLTTLATLSDGCGIPNPRLAKRAERQMRVRKRALARCERHSRRRKKVKAAVSRYSAYVKNARHTYLHQVSARLVRENDRIVIEDIRLERLACSAFSKLFNDAGWGLLRTMLTYKAESAGRELIAVDPRRTSQTCPECGFVAKKKLSERIHRCDCGCVLGRDHAAAKVILARGRSGARATERKAVA